MKKNLFISLVILVNFLHCENFSTEASDPKETLITESQQLDTEIEAEEEKADSINQAAKKYGHLLHHWSANKNHVERISKTVGQIVGNLEYLGKRNKQAFHFDGKTRILTGVSSNPAEYTIMAFIKPRRMNRGRILSKFTGSGTSSAHNYGSIILDIIDSKIRLYMSPNTLGRPLSGVLTPANSLKENTWQHVAATYSKGLVRIYINGKLAAEDEVGKQRITWSADRQWVIGEDIDVRVNEHFQGGLDEVMVFSHALSAKKIKRLAKLVKKVCGKRELHRISHVRQHAKNIKRAVVNRLRNH